jgi:hypothetical protein
MKELQQIEFVPTHQPFDEQVKFKLAPLDLQGQYQIQASFGDGGIPGWDGIVAASRYIRGWSGPIGDYSRQRVREVVGGQSDFNWVIWLAQITARLYGDSLLKEDTEKKS